MVPPLIETKELKKYFQTRSGLLHAVDDINIQIQKGQTLGVVGESGCGKSTLGRVILRLLESTSGQVLYNGQGWTCRSRIRPRRPGFGPFGFGC